MIENNKLIAEFIGVYSEENGYDYTKIGNKGVCYHTSWDWLMPVVDKIESLDQDDVFDVEFKMEKGAVEIICNKYQQSEEFCLSRLESTYKAVVEFIKWYNEQGGKDE
jgi:hypothetical protein